MRQCRHAAAIPGGPGGDGAGGVDARRFAAAARTSSGAAGGSAACAGRRGALAWRRGLPAAPGGRRNAARRRDARGGPRVEARRARGVEWLGRGVEGPPPLLVVGGTLRGGETTIDA